MHWLLGLLPFVAGQAVSGNFPNSYRMQDAAILLIPSAILR
jgi:hypothetical protein